MGKTWLGTLIAEYLSVSQQHHSDGTEGSSRRHKLWHSLKIREKLSHAPEARNRPICALQVRSSAAIASSAAWQKLEHFSTKRPLQVRSSTAIASCAVWQKLEHFSTKRPFRSGAQLFTTTPSF